MKSASIPDFKFKHEIGVRSLKCVSALVTIALVNQRGIFYTADLHLLMEMFL